MKLLALSSIAICLLFGTVFPNSSETRTRAKSDRPSAIVGGQDVGREFGFVAKVLVIRDDKSSLCSGALIHESWVLTAGHCLIDWSTGAEDIWVCLREDGCEAYEAWQFERASAYAIRPEFLETEETSWDHPELDQGLIHLEEPVLGITPVTMFVPYSVANTTSRGAIMDYGVSLDPPQIGAHVGWGVVQWAPEMEEDQVKDADTLQKLPVRVRRARWWDNGVFLSQHPSWKSSHVGPGDSGSPLLVWTLRGWTLAGVTAAGDYERGHAYSGSVTAEMYRWVE